MIYNNSNDPIEIKKIFLCVWSLRDQIEAIIREHLHKNQAVKLSPVDIQKIIHEYYRTPVDQDYERSTLETSPIGEGQGGESDPKQAIEKKIESEMERGFLEEEKKAWGSTLLSDINMEKIAFFSQRSFLNGQSVIIEFLVPRKFTLNAEILYCKNYNMSSRVISASRPKFRLMAKFNFLRPGERTLLRQFVSSIGPSMDELNIDHENSMD